MLPVPAAALPYLGVAVGFAVIAPIGARLSRYARPGRPPQRLSRPRRWLVTAAFEVFALYCACEGLQVWLGANALGGAAQLIVGVAPVAFVALCLAGAAGWLTGWASVDIAPPARDDTPPA